MKISTKLKELGCCAGGHVGTRIDFRKFGACGIYPATLSGLTLGLKASQRKGHQNLSSNKQKTLPNSGI